MSDIIRTINGKGFPMFLRHLTNREYRDAISFDVNDATQYATVYNRAGDPLGTLIRRTIMEGIVAPDSAHWRLYDLAGREVRKIWLLSRTGVAKALYQIR